MLTDALRHERCPGEPVGALKNWATHSFVEPLRAPVTVDGGAVAYVNRCVRCGLEALRELPGNRLVAVASYPACRSELHLIDVRPEDVPEICPKCGRQLLDVTTRDDAMLRREVVLIHGTT